MSTRPEKTLIISCHSAGMGSILEGTAAGLLYAQLTGRKEILLNRHNFKRTVKAKWKGLFSK